LLVPRFGTVTVTFREPEDAPASIVNRPVMLVSLDTTRLLARTPVPLTSTVVLPGTKPVPTRVKAGLEPVSPLVGVIDISVGGTGSFGDANRKAMPSLKPPPGAGLNT